MTQALGMAPAYPALWCTSERALYRANTRRRRYFQRHGHGQPAERSIELRWEWTPADSSTDDVYFEEFAAQGQNLFVDSGDDGNWSHAEFVWPADSVYITAVGGTVLTTTGAGGAWASETGWADTGGGISPDDFPIPSWQ